MKLTRMKKLITGYEDIELSDCISLFMQFSLNAELHESVKFIVIL